MRVPLLHPARSPLKKMSISLRALWRKLSDTYEFNEYYSDWESEVLKNFVVGEDYAFMYVNPVIPLTSLGDQAISISMALKIVQTTEVPDGGLSSLSVRFMHDSVVFEND